MDITKILVDLKTERTQIDEAILTLERLADGRGKRRGRPPTWLVEARAADPEKDATASAAPVKGKRGPKASNKAEA